MTFIHRNKRQTDKKLIQKIGQEENERCLLCGCELSVRRDTPIEKRQYYVIGCGQLCGSCYYQVYYK